jgi:hypothetical protein
LQVGRCTCLTDRNACLHVATAGTGVGHGTKGGRRGRTNKVIRQCVLDGVHRSPFRRSRESLVHEHPQRGVAVVERLAQEGHKAALLLPRVADEHPTLLPRGGLYCSYALPGCCLCCHQFPAVCEQQRSRAQALSTCVSDVPEFRLHYTGCGAF